MLVAIFTEYQTTGTPPCSRGEHYGADYQESVGQARRGNAHRPMMHGSNRSVYVDYLVKMYGPRQYLS